MSFSSEVKKELLALYGTNRHCLLAELAAMLCYAGTMTKAGGRIHITFVTENELAADKYVHLLSLAVGICVPAAQRPHMQQKNRSAYRIILTEDRDVSKLWKELFGQQPLQTDGQVPQSFPLASDRLLQKSCCKRAFLRGAFLTSGSMSNPKKSYHFEIVCASYEKALQIREQFSSFALDAKIIPRKNHEIVYLKEGAQIVDALNIMGAHMALMDLENVRIIKEMRNDINRRVNCETANINKTVHAAYRQQEAIRYLQQHDRLRSLSAPLQEIAALRMEYPEASIQELGTMCSPQVGKSGVNHRLRKLEETAKQMGYEKKDAP